MAAIDDRRQRALRNAQQWVEEKWKEGENTPCPMCGHNLWAIAEPVAMQGYGNIMGGTAPFIPVVCQTCGTTQLLPVNRVGDYPGLAGDEEGA